MSDHLLTELRRAYPGRARGADYENSRADAIALHCLDCSGGSRSEVANCVVKRCFLWRFRPYGETARPDGIVPSREEYDAATAEKANGAGVEALRRHREAHDTRPDAGQSSEGGR